jgi:hypothetical protein
MNRRLFVGSVAALGAGAALKLAPGQTPTASAMKTTPGTSGPDPLNVALRRGETTRQLTTFDPVKKSKTLEVPRGRRVQIGEVKGTGYITSFWLTFPGWFWQHWNTNGPVNQSILKTLILRIYWDGATKPAVEAPVGDFFGAGLCEISSFASRYFGTSSGGFFCKFPMPFRRGFRIELENVDAEIDTDVFCNVLYQLTDTLPAEAAYFHAQFNTAHNEGPAPVPIAEAVGAGHYVGCQLYMQGKERNYLSFLEAPEYVYLDGDREKPTIVGTGLEDYFLGGWYFREGTLIGPDHGVPVKDTLNSAVAMYRAHTADAIHFRERLRFAFINPWAPERLRPFCYSSVGYLYLNSPEGQGVALPPAKDLLCWYRIKNTDRLSVP